MPNQAISNLSAEEVRKFWDTQQYAPIQAQVPINQYLPRANANQLVPVMAPIPPRAAHPLKLTKFEQAKRDLSKFVSIEVDDKTKASYFYGYVQPDLAIDYLGWWNPVNAGRPKEFAQRLLEGIPSPAAFKSYKWRICGLTYYTPSIAGRFKSRSRTTVAGIALLQHWSEAYPAFAPFYNAYYSKKGEREIRLDCVDFSLGHLPLRYVDMLESDKRGQERIAEKIRIQMEVEKQERARYQTYQDMLNMQQNVNMQEYIGDQVSSDSGLLGSMTLRSPESAVAMQIKAEAYRKQMLAKMAAPDTIAMRQAVLEQQVEMAKRQAEMRMMSKDGLFGKLFKGI